MQRIIQYSIHLSVIEYSFSILRILYILIGWFQYPFSLFIDYATFPGCIIHTAIPIVKHKPNLLLIILSIRKLKINHSLSLMINKSNLIIQYYSCQAFGEDPGMCILCRYHIHSRITVEISTFEVFGINNQRICICIRRKQPVDAVNRCFSGKLSMAS